MKRILAHILPMTLVHRCVFVDVVSGKDVNRYRERLTGRIVMAEGRFALFRVEVERTTL